MTRSERGRGALRDSVVELPSLAGADLAVRDPYQTLGLTFACSLGSRKGASAECRLLADSVEKLDFR
jgi:hypothetical protein